jgi:flagellar basal-body rod modification protein FlgD
MSINSINNSVASGSAASSGTKKTSNSNSYLSMEDFFKLMVAQLSNQDMNNTVDNTQFINQMAQFSMIQAISDMSTASATAYSVNLIGKEVTVTENGENGVEAVTGIVDGVNLYSGTAKVIVDGKMYSVNDIAQVKTPKIVIPKDGTK